MDFFQIILRSFLANSAKSRQSQCPHCSFLDLLNYLKKSSQTLFDLNPNALLYTTIFNVIPTEPKDLPDGE